MHDEFEHFESGLTSPAAAAWTITPDDVADLPHATRGIYVGQSGDVMVEMVSGDTVTFPNLQAGMIYALRVMKVFASGTTATGLVGVK